MACNIVLCANFLLLSSCKIDGSKPLMGVINKVETSVVTDGNAADASQSAGVVDKKEEILNTELLMVKSPKALPEQILQRFAYVASYNKEMKNPNWVAWHLTADHVNGPYKRDGIDFMEDEDVPTPRATKMDYVQSGYDRGHMCPSGDNKWSEQAQRESFLYTNCCPQLHNLNAGDWNELEASCRKWAKQYGEVWIVCGPMYKKQKHKTIGLNKVVVPEAFFKVILTKKDGDFTSVGFIYRNEKANKSKSEYMNTVREVERLTGYNFFSALPDEVENRIETTINEEDWQ